MNHTIFITGGAGYVGEMLCEQFAKRDDVSKIITVDKEPITDFLKRIPKLIYIQHNLADDGWQEQVAALAPDIVIHAAWQIRTMYGAAKTQWHWNIDGSDKVFAFTGTISSVKKLIHFSTAASYAAYIDNRIEYQFLESDPLRDDGYLYAKEKKVAEEHLRQYIETRQASGLATPQVTIVRLAAVTGPRGRGQKIRFGLQSALQGTLQTGFLHRFVSTLTAVMPATKSWVRQFVHEDDVVDVVAMFAFEPFTYGVDVFNLVPDTEPVLPKDMGQAVGKRVLYLHPRIVQLVFFMFWHLTRGRIPTAPHVWRFYSYPIVMSGKKLRAVYTCRYSAKEAISTQNGRYGVDEKQND